jgi:hypothetical protein
VLPANASDLRAKAAAAASTLDAAAPLILQLRAALDNMNGLLGRMMPAYDAIGTAIAAYIHSGGPWSAVYSAITAGADKVVFASSAVAIANAQVGPAAARQLAGVTGALAAYSGDRAAVISTATGAIAFIDVAPDAQAFVASLDAIAPAYAALGSPPSKASAIWHLLIAWHRCGLGFKCHPFCPEPL